MCPSAVVEMTLGGHWTILGLCEIDVSLILAGIGGKERMLFWAVVGSDLKAISVRGRGKQY